MNEFGDDLTNLHNQSDNAGEGLSGLIRLICIRMIYPQSSKIINTTVCSWQLFIWYYPKIYFGGVRNGRIMGMKLIEHYVDDSLETNADRLLRN